MMTSTHCFYLSAICRPCDFVDGSGERLVERVGPTNFVAQSEGVEGAGGEVVAVRGPRHGRDGIVMGARV